MEENSKREFETPWIVHDEPLRNEDKAFFHCNEFAITLARIIADQNTRTPLTIGVNGAWGSGKTTLLKRVQRLLDEPLVDKQHQFAGTTPVDQFRTCKTVWFNAWKYRQEDELLAALVRCIVNAMKKGNWLDKLKVWVEGTEQATYDFPAMFLNSLKFDFGIIGLKVEADPSKYRQESPIKTHAAFFDHFDDAFQRLLALWVHGTARKEIDEHKGALVVFIDDLDRCLPDKVVQVLEAVKLFIDKPGCIFVIGADTNMVQLAVKKHYAEKKFDEMDEGEYLEKVIQLRFNLPPNQTDRMQGFVEAQMDKESPLRKHWKTVVEGAEGNPRKVKTFLNDVNLRWAMWKNSGEGGQVDYDAYVAWEVLMRAAPKFRSRIYGTKPNSEQMYTLLAEWIEKAFRWADGDEEARRDFKDDVDEKARRVLVEIGKYRQKLTHQETLKSLLYLAELNNPGEQTPSAGEVVSGEKGKRLPAETRTKEEVPGASPKNILRFDEFDLDLLEIPAGGFLMGSSDQDKLAYDDEKPQHFLELPAFWMGRTPVTVAQFTAFAEANLGFQTDAEKAGKSNVFTGEKWQEVQGASWKAPQGKKSNVKGKMDHPVTHISWHDAMAYCAWLYGVVKAQLPSEHVLRLPTEAEWEKSARGTAGNLYPWGNDAPDANRCNFGHNVKDTTPVGRYSPQGDSPYGCVDMAGNVWEWTHSLFKPYPYQADEERESETAGGTRVLRGGGFYTSAWYVRCAYRYYYPNFHDVNYGFRVCVSPISFISGS